jgi:hypothetical protein
MKLIIFATLLAAMLGMAGWNSPDTLVSPLTAVIANGQGPIVSPQSGQASHIAEVKIGGTAGTVSATVTLYGSNDAYCFTDQTNCAQQSLNSWSLTGTSQTNVNQVATGGGGQGIFAITANYRYYWMTVASIAGTNATVNGWIN